MTRLLTPLRELRALETGAAPGAFEGYGSVFGVTDSYGDVVAKGAFKRTLREWKQGRGKYPPMLLQHGGGFFAGGAEDLVPVGVWEEMREDDTGLYVQGRLLAIDTDLGKRVHAAMLAGALDGLSIGFQTRDVAYGKEGTDEPARTLKAVDLWEVSLVTYPANSDARVTQVKRAADMNEREFEQLLRESGLSRKEAMVVIAKGWRALRDSAREGQEASASGLSAEDADQLVRRFVA